MCNLISKEWNKEISFELSDVVFQELERLVFAGITRVYFTTSKDKFDTPNTSLRLISDNGTVRNYKGKHGITISFVLCKNDTCIPKGYTSLVLEVCPVDIVMERYERVIAEGKSGEVVVFITDYKKDELRIRVTRRRLVELLGVYS